MESPETPPKVRIPFINEKAPPFRATSTQGEINFPVDYEGKYVILFAHPADFTPICSSEFMLFASKHEDFRKLNTEIIGISADSLYSHIAWIKTIKEKLEYKGMKDITIPFPVIADMDKEIIKKYGMVHADNNFATRATFIIDPDHKIRAFLFYPMYNGRNIDEIFRLLVAIQRQDKYSVATPGGWNPGDPILDRIPRTYNEAYEKEKNPGENLMCYDWFSCFREDPVKNTEEKQRQWD